MFNPIQTGGGGGGGGEGLWKPPSLTPDWTGLISITSNHKFPFKYYLYIDF